MVHNCPKMKKKEPDKQCLCVTKNKLNQILIFQVYQNIAHEYYFYFNYEMKHVVAANFLTRNMFLVRYHNTFQNSNSRRCCLEE